MYAEARAPASSDFADKRQARHEIGLIMNALLASHGGWSNHVQASDRLIAWRLIGIARLPLWRILAWLRRWIAVGRGLRIGVAFGRRVVRLRLRRVAIRLLARAG